jgi:hypothetical protein
MKWGGLRDHFKGVARKRLTAHEVDPAVSNGHEFQGVNGLREILGSDERRGMSAVYFLLDDDDSKTEVLPSSASWYDSRANQPHRSAEWRLYYPADAGALQAKLAKNDLMVIAVPNEGPIAILLANKGSSSEIRLLRLFGLDDDRDASFRVRRFDDAGELDFAAVNILEELGLGTAQPIATADDDAIAKLVDELVQKYPEALPPGRVISALVHAHVDHDPVADPDGALTRWIEAEAAAFRLWEDALIARTLSRGFTLPGGYPDVDAFREFTMRLRQSRVSRAGGALQIHTARILASNGIAFEEQVITEPGERPDFVFPSAKAYHDLAWPPEQLAMLATKFTLKDRWRQVLNEAERIPRKHLLTIDGAVTVATRKAIMNAGIQLVVPESVREKYGRPVLGSEMLMNVGELLRSIQSPRR